MNGVARKPPGPVLGRVLFERPDQRLGDPGGCRLGVGPSHAGHPLPAAGDERLAPVLVQPHVVEAELDLCLSQLGEPHPDGQLVEGGDLREELAVDLEGEEFEIVSYVGEDVGGPLLQEHLPAPALPSQVVDVVDVADEIGLFEADRVDVLEVLAHDSDRPSVSTATTMGSGTSRTAVTSVAMRSPAEAKTTHSSRSP